MNRPNGTKREGASSNTALPAKQESTSISGTLNTLLRDACLTQWLQ